MDNQNEQSLVELIKSIDSSIEDLKNHKADLSKLPSNFEILVRGVSSNKAIDAIFSSKLDGVISKLLDGIQSGDVERILQNEELIENLATSIFGEKSFKGPVSNTILNTISSTMNSVKYNTMKSALGKTGIGIKKVRMVMKNLKKGEGNFSKDPELLQKYRDAVYAIKKTLKFISRIYRSRKIINRKVFDGLSNVVYEQNMGFYSEYDEML